MKIENITAYKLIEHHYSEDLKSEAYLFEHIKSGARVSILENDDENKVFYIAFRTPPKDSTGVAHILEHSVLCGSEKYPLKDPFVELVKGSLNTFLNAMTYPDKTVYPVASCNDQDFKNLMSVYMDAVLKPNIYKEEKIFRQEGWHYETDEDGNLIINGVVYNEMKGAFSSPDDVLSREIFNSLYPDTTYGVESGGDPKNIPDLTYEDFLEFHKSYYHPVNSYIFLYGNADMEERLDWLDKEYLGNYSRIEISSEPGVQKAFDKPVYMSLPYPITDDESSEKQTYLSYNAVVGDVMDPELYIAFQMIDYALVGADGTPLRKALLDAGIGTEINSQYENGIYQPFYSIVAKNAEESDLKKFEQIIADVLARVAEEGFDENALLACVNSLEFHFREGDTGSYPKGLLYGLKALDSWLYDKDKPFIHLESLDVFAKLRERITTDYYKQLVKKYLIDNDHKTILVLKPEKGLTAKNEEALAKKLAAYRASITEAEYEDIKKKAAELKEYQDEEDSEEAKACLPCLERSDIKREVQPSYNEETEIDGIKTLFHEVETNGILYLNLLFDIEGLPEEYEPYVGLLKTVLGCVDTEKFSYEQLGYEIDKRTGNISQTTIYGLPGWDADNYRIFFGSVMSVLSSQIDEGLELVWEILFKSKLDDAQRIGQIIAEWRSRTAGFMMNGGHTVASAHALSYLTQFSRIKEDMAGLGFFRFLEAAEADFDAKKGEICDKLKKTLDFILRKDNLMLDVTGSRAELEALKGKMGVMLSLLKDKPAGELRKTKKTLVKANEGFTNSAQVQYVCRAGNYAVHGLEFDPSLYILKTILGYEYLWNEVRVKGGAYGCMSRFTTYGEVCFVSYRDPNLERTIEVYEGISDFLRRFTADEKKMTRYIIGTMSELDTPLTPRLKGSRSLQIWLDGDTDEKRNARRAKLLSSTQEDIRALARFTDVVMEDKALCVVGNEGKIKEAANLFGEIKPLFNK
ncbi:MAG: insulinase family protein [Lachnospiraceae bacterium]|nr:insulinase family protein [Lachnospiraceae bacterium]